MQWSDNCGAWLNVSLFCVPHFDGRPESVTTNCSTYIYIFLHCLFFIMLPSGTRDDTRKAMERAICLPHDFHCVHLQMKKLREKLASSLQMASQIYYNPSITVTSSDPKRLLCSQRDADILSA